jgi:hypothetical protein
MSTLTKAGLIGLSGFVVFSVVWIVWLIQAAWVDNHKVVGVSLMFSPLFWSLALTAAFGCASIYLLARR